MIVCFVVPHATTSGLLRLFFVHYCWFDGSTANLVQVLVRFGRWQCRQQQCCCCYCCCCCINYFPSVRKVRSHTFFFANNSAASLSYIKSLKCKNISFVHTTIMCTNSIQKILFLPESSIILLKLVWYEGQLLNLSDHLRACIISCISIYYIWMTIM